MNNSRTQGSAFVVIIVILTIAIIGGLGFVFWQNFIHEEPVSINEATNTGIGKDDAKRNELPEAFSIKEYNTEFTIPVELKDAVIKYEQRQIGEASFLAFTTQRVIDLGGDCSKAYPFGDLVTLSRANESTSDDYQVFTTKEIDGYYYHIGTIESSGLTPESTCPMNELARNDLNALVDALKTLAPQN